MPSPKGARGKSTAAAGKNKTLMAEIPDFDSIDLGHRALVITVGGFGVAQSGPYKGERIVHPTEIYVYGQKLAMISHVVYKQAPEQPLPELHFTFSDIDRDAIENNETVKRIYEKYVHLVRDRLPWASYTSPLGNRAPTTLNVLDLGIIRPETPSP